MRTSGELLTSMLPIAPTYGSVFSVGNFQRRRTEATTKANINDILVFIYLHFFNSF
jgi:hypothetical protein